MPGSDDAMVSRRLVAPSIISVIRRVAFRVFNCSLHSAMSRWDQVQKRPTVSTVATASSMAGCCNEYSLVGLLSL